MSDANSERPIPEGKYVDVTDGLRMHYHEAGPADGPALLFIHGSGPGASGWSNYNGNYPAFAEAGYRCIVPDTIGYGYSSKPEDGDYSLTYLAAAYRALLENLGIHRVAIVGNSQGGALAIKLALAYPDLVSKLVLMAPGGLEKREVFMEMAGIKTMVKAFFAKDGVTREGMRRTFELQLFDKSLITDEIIEQRYQIARTQPKTVISKMKVDNQEEQLKDITCPVLCFWGVDDQFCPVSGATKVALQVPQNKTMIVSRCGHWVMVEHRALFNRVSLQFLEGELD